ncbi:VCBS domain-containing protein [Bradyrhizobium sp. 1.29L]
MFTSSSVNSALPGFGANANIGTFTIDPSMLESNTDTNNGATLGWHFTLDNNNAVLQSLAQGQSITQVYTVTFRDNHDATVTQDVTVTINGVNDAPTITSGAAAAAGAVTEDATLSIGGTLEIQDFDLIDTHTAQAVFKSSSVSSALPGFGANANIGTFTIDPSVFESSTDTNSNATLGWHFSLDNSNAVLQSLAQGQTITQVYTVTFTDDHGAHVSQDVTVTINGANDAPTITSSAADAAGAVTEDAGATLSIDGTLAIQDPDLIDTHTAEAVLKSSTSSVQLPGFATGTPLGTFTIDCAVAELSTDTNNGATLGWHFTLDNSNPVLQSLAQGQSITQVYAVTFTDDHGAQVSQDVTVTINGVNDAPTLDNATLAAVAGNESDPCGAAIADLFANKFQDVDTGAGFKAIAVTSDAATAAQGTWQYALAGTNQWVAIGSVSDTQALVLSPDTLIRFVPADGFTGTPEPLGVHALDDTYTGPITTNASTAAIIDITATGAGGSTPVSHAVATIDTSVTAPAGGPVINTEGFRLEHIIENNTDIITDIVVTDGDVGAATDDFTVTLSTAHPVLSHVDLYPTSGTLEEINLGFETGLTYNPIGASSDPEAEPPATDQITLTVTDSAGHYDTVNFIFAEGASGQGITLTGSGGKDVIFATESSDTLIGGGAKDQFVFAPTSLQPTVEHSLNDFEVGLDKIDLRQFTSITSWTQLSALAEQQGADTVLNLDGNDKILLKNTVAGSLHAGDFILHVS